MIFPIAMSWIKADFSRGNKIFFPLSFCSISSIWRLLLLVSPSNMWKMFSTMQSRWLGHHLLSHRSLHSCRCLSKPENNSVRSHWEGKYNERKNGPTYATTQILLWLVPHWQPAWYRAFLGTPSQGLKAGENLRGVGGHETGRPGQPFVVFYIVMATWKLLCGREEKGERGEDLGPLRWRELLLPLVLAMHLSIRKSGPNFQRLKLIFKQIVRYTKSPPSHFKHPVMGLDKHMIPVTRILEQRVNWRLQWLPTT